MFKGVKDFFSGLGEITGQDYAKTGNEYEKLRQQALDEIIQKAITSNANAIIGTKINFTQIPSPNGSGVLIVAAYGTAVQTIKKETTTKVGGIKKTNKNTNKKTNKNKNYAPNHPKLKRHHFASKKKIYKKSEKK
jgi:uncharacterized protein YbjQ (UPF0145 family)